MKNFLNNLKFRKFLYILAGIAFSLVILDLIVLPWYVRAPETKVPKVINMNETQAIKIMEDSDLEPVVSDTTFDDKVPKGSVILQKPMAGETVKKGRRVYLFISSGEPVVNVPMLNGKTIRDARFALERIGLRLGEISKVPSENPRDIIFDQQWAMGTPLKRGDAVNITVSAGQVIEGDIVVPDLIGKSLSEVKTILSDSSLSIGKINYQKSFSLLPNTILDQYPSKGSKVNKGAKVDLFVTKGGEENDKEIIEE